MKKKNNVMCSIGPARVLAQNKERARLPVPFSSNTAIRTMLVAQITPEKTARIDILSTVSVMDGGLAYATITCLLVSRSGEDWHIILQNSQASDAAIMISVAAPALERYVMIALPKQGGNVNLRGC
jgi:hypothetical protein